MNARRSFSLVALMLRLFIAPVSGATTIGILPGNGTTGQVLAKTSNNDFDVEWATVSAGSGTVTSASVTTANGVSATVANAATTPAFTFTLGAITPSSVNGLTLTTSTGTLTIASAKVFTVSNTLTLTGTDGSTLAIGAGGTLGSNAYTSTAYVPTTTTVNGHALNANVSVTASDVSLGSVTNDAQTKASVVPNTLPSAGQLLVGNAGGTAYAPISSSGNVTISSAGAMTIGATQVTNAMLAGSITAAKLVGTDIATTAKITSYNGISTVSNGHPGEYATVDLTAQSGAVGATTAYTPTADGMFRLSAILKITTTGTSPVAGPITITYTDADGSVAQSHVMLLRNTSGAAVTTTVNNSTTTGTVNGDIVFYAKSGVAIQYAIAVSGTFGSGRYSAHLKLEAL